MIMIVGISGVTNGGKTTLSMNLKSQLKEEKYIQIFHQDHYFKDDGKSKRDPNTGFIIMDVPDSYDMDRLTADVKQFVKSVKGNQDVIVIVEGILLYQHRELNKLFDRRYFLTLPFEEAQQRRQRRVYDWPDEPGAFELHIWPMYVHYRDLLIDKKEEIKYISGTCNIETVLKIASEDIAACWKAARKQNSWFANNQFPCERNEIPQEETFHC